MRLAYDPRIAALAEVISAADNEHIPEGRYLNFPADVSDWALHIAARVLEHQAKEPGQ